MTVPALNATSTLIRGVRLVPVGTPVMDDGVVDLRIRHGDVCAVDRDLPSSREELVVDAGGRWAIPGLWDQHVHMGQWAQTRIRLDVSGATSAEAVARMVADHIAGLPADHDTSFVCGHGFRPATWARQPTVAELDQVSGDHAVALAAGDGHHGWLNSKALATLGVARRTGPLVEREWFALVPAIGALTGGMDDDSALRASVDAAVSRGVVGIVDFEFAAGYLDWPQRIGRGIDQLRVRPAVYPDRLEDAVAAGLRTGQLLAGGRGLATMGSLKIISDGSLNTRTAYCCEPYADGDTSAHPRGEQNYQLDELITLLSRAQTSGLEIALHAIGDAAVAVALDAFAATGATGTVEHAQLMRRADIGRMNQLGLRASVQPAHLWDDRDVAAQCWPDRTDRCFPLRSLLSAGVPLVLGSDAPVSPLDPWLAMAAAVHRSADQREAWNPAESLTASQALAASTDEQTTLGPGSRGDLVLLDDNPLGLVDDSSVLDDSGVMGDSGAVAAHLRTMRVAATFLAGRPTHLDL